MLMLEWSGMASMDSTILYGRNCVKQLPHVCDGTSVIIGGYVKKDARAFTIDLQTNPTGGQFDIAMHVNIRFDQRGIVVRNSRKTGRWDNEERDGLPMPVKPGDAIECILLITNHLIKIAFNGQHYCEFLHRLPKESIRDVAVTGDIDVMNLTVYGPGIMQDSFGGFNGNMVGSIQPPGFSQGQQTINSSSSVKLQLPGGLYHGRQIYIRGTPGSTRFTVNLRYHISHGNIVFHFVPHMQKKVVIRNSFLRGSYGFEEVHHPAFPFVTGYPFDMIIRCEFDRIKVAVNNAHFIDYLHRDNNLAAVSCIEVLDDIRDVTVRTPPEVV